MSLAPIVLFTYNRLWHTKQTIEALQKNELANESELFIYSDGGKNEESWGKVHEVREYLKTIQGFKNITIIEQEKNLGLADSIISGVTKIVNQYGKIIVLEDDIVTSPYFLRFMNDALDFYENEEKVMTVSGYSNIEIPKNYKYKVYFAHISSSWGWATWKEKWNIVRWDNEPYVELLKNNELLKRFEKKVGMQRIKMLKMQMEGKLDSWAVRRLFSQLIQKKMTIFPYKTFVKNIGFDGTGVHCGKNINFDSTNMVSLEKINTLIHFFEDSEIHRVIYEKNK
ncbi:MAG: glycosyltransferase [Sulfurimonas sp.]